MDIESKKWLYSKGFDIAYQKKTIEDIDKIDRKLGNTNIENALFVGSTAELQKLLKDKKSWIV